MALFALLLVAILVLLGIYSVVFFVFHIAARTTRNEPATSDQQSTHALLVELDSQKARHPISEAEYEEERKRIMENFVSRTPSSR